MAIKTNRLERNAIINLCVYINMCRAITEGRNGNKLIRAVTGRAYNARLERERFHPWFTREII